MELLLNTASLPGAGGQWSSRSFCIALLLCFGAVGSAPPSMHCLTAWGQWAVGYLQSTATLPGGSGQCNWCDTLPHCLGAVGNATPAMHSFTASGQSAVGLVQCIDSLLGGIGQGNSCNTLPHHPGPWVVGLLH